MQTPHTLQLVIVTLHLSNAILGFAASSSPFISLWSSLVSSFSLSFYVRFVSHFQ